MPARLKNYICFALFCGLLLAEGCKKNSSSSTQSVVATLKASAPFPMGSAVTSNGILSNYYYQGVLLTEYNSMTADYEMKFDITEPQQDVFNYAPGDALVNFAAQHHFRMHGHNFIWHQALPPWVLTFQGDTSAWESLFKTHIETEAIHYKGKVASWDVVNEAIRDDNGQLRNRDATPGDGSGSIWRQHLGPDYIARAFVYAHEADPNALLFYNDYGQEWGGVKLDSMISLVTGLKKRGIPISGIGMQMHIDINADTTGIASALKRLAATGLLVHVSELDISVNPGADPNIVFTSALQVKQAALYQFIAETYRASVPAAQRYGITTWEFSDADSWIPVFFNRKDWPLPFDAAYKKKPAYYGLLRGLTN
ncbi:endo-1,4-beta-xylanase [Mucilaginibacter sp.]|uniref:endo-1,4-beta-xylanase n=1 Tax=Mucilaginibacter sp. TaxID=1882438 RepID=UPI00284FD549|nr:endo-1,4-beta-xylanase [Mucilaginibacter sp.]MDR3696815.1 endo-1,4-beta-xylanase [Mucilaginibacter sp.]